MSLLESVSFRRPSRFRYLPKGHRFRIKRSGADDPSEGKYEIYIGFQYIIDPRNDVKNI